MAIRSSGDAVGVMGRRKCDPVNVVHLKYIARIMLL